MPTNTITLFPNEIFVPFKELKTSSVSVGDPPKYKSRFHCSGKIDMTLCSEKLEELFGVDPASQEDSFAISYCYLIQKRKHKKKRINKKWAKRYGFITKQIVIPGLRFEEGNDSNTAILRTKGEING